MSEAPLLDGAVLDDLIGHIGDEAVRAIVGLFIGECHESAVAIGAAASPDAVRRAAHSLKSSAGQLGAAALAEAALEVEAAAEQKSPGLPQLIAGLLDCAARTEAVMAGRLAG
jgi:HPt (histidine-containing phosphotransfer) domain-containing protein